MRRLPFWIGILALAFSGNGCSEPPPLKLTAAQRDQVDTLYLKQVAVLGKELDSLCTLQTPERVQQLVDSLLEIRRQEEELLRQRYLKSQQ